MRIGQRGQKAAKILRSFLKAAILLGICFVMLYPVLFMLSSSFKSAEDSYNPTVIWVPMVLSFQGFTLALKYLDYGAALLRTLIIVVPSVLLQMITTLTAGYGFSRFKFKGQGLLFGLLVFTIIVPTQTYIIPLYVNMKSFDFLGIGQLIGLFTGRPLTVNFINTYMPFYLPALFGAGIRSGLYIFIVRQFFKGLPGELENAAMIDGCGSLKTFWSVMLPNIIPAIATVTVFSIVWYYNDYLIGGMFLNNNMPLSPSLTMIKRIIEMQAQHTTGTNMSAAELRLLGSSILSAACLLTALPLSIMYLFAQRFFTESIGRTGIVG